MKIVREENARDFEEMMPVVILKLQMASPDAKSHEILSKFKENKVYKSYKNEQGYFVFPEPKESEAFLFPKLEEDNNHYSVKLEVITTDNFHKYIDLLSDDDITYLTDILDKPIEQEIDERAAEEIASDLDVEFGDKVIERSNTVTAEEARGLFDTLGKKDPMLARALYEFGRYATIAVQSQKGIDEIAMGILNDRDLGKGAYIAKVMDSILRYAKSNDPHAFQNVLRTGLYSLIEMKRNL